jgi:hypothetical protein
MHTAAGIRHRCLRGSCSPSGKWTEYRNPTTRPERTDLCAATEAAWLKRPATDRRVRARKLRQRRWRCVTGPADRRRRDRRPCPCQLRAGGLCAVRGKAPLLICSGAASRRGLPYGGSTRFYGGSTRWQGSSGPVYGAAAAVRGLVSTSGRLSLCFPDDEASCCGCRGPALPAARSRLTALVVALCGERRDRSALSG